MSRVAVVHEFELPLPPARVWPLVADTERLNRAAGQARIAVTPLEGAGAARFRVRTRLGGFAVEYEEQPFEWDEPRRFAVRRVMTQGPARELAMEARLEPEGDVTRVSMRLTVELRVALVAPFARASASRTLARFEAELQRVARLDETNADPARSVPTGVDAPDSALERGAAALARRVGPEQQALARRLARFIREGGDLAVGHLRPFELADAWGVERRAFLALCLEAVVAGLLELRWELVCPSCRVAAETVTDLSALDTDGHCQLCDLGFGVNLDEAVEATFRPAPAVRIVDLGPYCIGGPARTPHVLAQAVVASGHTVTLRAPDAPGRHRVFVRGGALAAVDVVATGPTEVALRVSPAPAVAAEGARDVSATARPSAAAVPGPTVEPRGAASDVSADAEAGAPAPADATVSPSGVAVAPGGRLAVSLNSALSERHVKLERLDWASRAATAHVVSTLPAFRRLFSGQALRSGVSLRVGRATLLFTDLTGSTALYSRVGDAAAFDLVQAHFELLRAAIDAHRGTIVKTIGDAVMAAFTDDADALAAGLAMLRGWPDFLRARADALDVLLKIGVHSGPCYAVTANGVLDYFGQTVNVAARLQGAAAPDEIVVDATLADAALAAGWLDGARVHERFEAVLKGLGAPLQAARIALVRSA